MNYNISNSGTLVAYDGDIPIFIKEQNRRVKKYQSRFEITPTPNSSVGRNIMYVGAPSQAGKTTFVKNFAEEMTRSLPINDILIFSEKEHDDLDSLGGNRIALNDSILEIELDMEKLRDSLVIFDDVDGIYDKDIRKKVFSFIERILKLGGEFKVHIIVTYHMMSNRNETRYLLYESQYIVIFPNTGSVNQTRNLFNNYVGLDRSQQDKILNSGSRWVMLYKNHPRYIVTNNSVEIL